MTDTSDGVLRIKAAIRRKRIRQIALWGGSFLVISAIIATAVWYQKRNVAAPPGEIYADAGDQHIALSAPLPRPYNSNPPSSGGHYAKSASWGIYDYEVDDKIFLHNLEHGGVWISYRPSVSSEVVSQLKDIVSEFGGSKLVMAPRSANDADIAVAAWARVHKFDLENGALTDARKVEIRAFYKAYKNRGPEFVPDSVPGIDPKTVQ